MVSNQIMTLRFWGLILLRAIALGMVVCGSVCLMYGLGIGIANYSGVQGLYHGLFLLYGNENGSWLWFGVALLIPGFALMMFTKRIVRWVISVPAHECPKCGYELKNLTSASCPECGIALMNASGGSMPPAGPGMPAR